MKILIVDDETLIRKTMQAQIESLQSTGTHTIMHAKSYDDAAVALDASVVDLAFIDINLDRSKDRLGLELIKQMKEHYPSTVTVAMTGQDEDALVVECLRSGASDYLPKPFDEKMLFQVLRKAPTLHRLLRKNQTLKAQVGTKFIKTFELQSKSPAFNSIIAQAKKMQASGQSILIRGESGSGKEVFAQYLWSLEGDESRPFIPINCGAIAPTLAESELFGHVKGAFSGATEHRIGKFEAASGGDLFLDELATLSLDVQVKLLRVLSSGDITPVGKNTPKKVECRILAATNENLEELIQAKTFREDLFFRVKQFTVTLPALRDRKEDILDLAKQFLRDKNFIDKRFSKEAEQLLLTYSWPGNVRELRSAVEVAAVLSDGIEITPADLTPHLMSSKPVLGKMISEATGTSEAGTLKLDEATVQNNFNHLTREFEQKLIDFAMEKKGSESAAAKFLGIPRSTLGDIRRRLKAN